MRLKRKVRWEVCYFGLHPDYFLKYWVHRTARGAFRKALNVIAATGEPSKVTVFRFAKRGGKWRKDIFQKKEASDDRTNP